jgi:hypothetical protein
MTLTTAPVGLQTTAYDHIPGRGCGGQGLPSSGTLCLVARSANRDWIIYNSDLSGFVTGQPFLTNGNLQFVNANLYCASVPSGCSVSVTTV